MAGKAPKIKLMMKLCPGDPSEFELPYVLIEGDRASLEFLGNLILEHANNPQDCGIQMYPNAQGKAYFKRGSNMGFYLHRLPCWNKLLKRREAAKKKKQQQKAEG